VPTLPNDPRDGDGAHPQRDPEPNIFVVFGATGDLARR
jgi:hypothetical protein